MPARSRLQHLAAVILPMLAAWGSGSFAEAQIYHVADLTAPQIQALDRERTVVLLPGGILEEHGPYLPAFSDGFWNERMTAALAEAIASRPGWSVLVFPLIPLGNSGANDIGGKHSFPGTYTVRFATLRTIFMDLASELGEQGFRRVFILHAHGAPNHSRALEQAGDFFRDTYGGDMIHLAGLLPVMEAWEGAKTEETQAEDGLPIHAGMDETSWMLFLRPELVRPEYQRAQPLGSDEMKTLIQIAERPDWPGYLGSPRLATAEHGRRIWENASAVTLDLAMEILNGRDAREIPRFSDAMSNSPEEVRLDDASLEYERRVQQRQQDWLRQRELQ